MHELMKKTGSLLLIIDYDKQQKQLNWQIFGWLTKSMR